MTRLDALVAEALALPPAQLDALLGEWRLALEAAQHGDRVQFELWIPGHVPSPNELSGLGLRQRINVKTSLKDRARLALTFRAAGTPRPRIERFAGPARVRIEMTRVRLLDNLDNAQSAVKPYIDVLAACPHQLPTWVPGTGLVMKKHALGTCPTLVLPHGDGPKSGYLFEPVRQIKGGLEGVRISISTP